ncbi:MAG: bifunctional heptose 7-phosphate kinase/heptose 1-phosphate adenyltransferase [Saprospiraceae bacterium]
MSDVFADFKNLNVLIVGDVMLDCYLHGKVDRISPEAPVPVVQLQTKESRLGGAANVALNIAALGATPYLCSVVGKDISAQTFFQLLQEQHINSKYIIQSSERPTTVKSRVLANHQQLIRIDEESQMDLTAQEEQQYLKSVRDVLEHKNIDVILFQDYNKGVLSKSVIREVILEAIKRDIPTAVDPKFKNFTAYKRVHLFKPNLLEVNRFLQLPISSTLANLQLAAEKIEQKLGNQYTLITLSDQGLFLKSNDKGKLYPTRIRQIADVCGAGDSVISVVALALALRLSAIEITKLANLAGGQVCESPGVVPINLQQLKTEYKKSAIGQSI